MVTMIVFITNVVFGELISLFGYDVRAKCTSSVSKEIVALRNNIWKRLTQIRCRTQKCPEVYACFRCHVLILLLLKLLFDTLL